MSVIIVTFPGALRPREEAVNMDKKVNEFIEKRIRGMKCHYKKLLYFSFSKKLFK